MRHIRTIILGACASLFFTAVSSVASPIIERIPVLQPVRIAYIKTTPAYRGTNVGWKIFAYTLDEANNGYAAVGDTLAGSGDSVQVLLIKYAGKYSFYKIFASRGKEQDSIQLQVFSKGSMQKFLYTSPWFPTKPIAVYCYLPASLSSVTPQVMVMHGIDRNAYSYGLAWTPFASANGWMVIAPEFNAADWSSDAYGLGNMFTGSDGTGSLNTRDKWTFSIVSEIQRTLVRGFGLTDTMYTLWGHSAGGQFVHRMVLFAWDPMIRRAIAGNPGWYTAPDSTIAYPWGVKHPFLSVTRGDLLTFVSRDLIIMRGTADTVRDSNLNVDPLSDAQGKNRYQRAGYFIQKGKDVSPSSRWLLLDVVGSAHDYQKMAVAAAAYLQGITPVKEERKAQVVPQHMGSYPNPFNASTNIVFTVTKPARTTVAVFNILGEKLLTLVDDVLSPGEYSRKFNGDAFGTGMYFCRIQSGQESSVVKLLLLK